MSSRAIFGVIGALAGGLIALATHWAALHALPFYVLGTVMGGAVFGAFAGILLDTLITFLRRSH